VGGVGYVQAYQPTAQLEHIKPMSDKTTQLWFCCVTMVFHFKILFPGHCYITAFSTKKGTSTHITNDKETTILMKQYC
jgi:hypothetical protein